METAALTTDAREPLVIYITRGFDAYTFFVDRSQLHRLPREMPDRITIALDQKQPFGEVFDPIHPYVLAILTGQDLASLRASGGVEVRDYDTQTTLWRPT